MDENKWEEISEVQTDYIDSARSEITDDTDISFLTVQVFCCESCISDITHCNKNFNGIPSDIHSVSFSSGSLHGQFKI